MMKLIVALAVFVAVSQAALNPASEWATFKAKYNKHYANKVEEEMRMRVFTEKLEKINKHNEKYELGLSTYKRGINSLSDLTFEEITKQKMGFKAPKGQNELKRNFHVRDYTKNLPDTVDWRNTQGVVTPIKNQETCGCCWAFSSTGGIEGQWFLKKNQTVSLSEQNLVDCATENNGCNGGWMDWAFDYVISNKGIDTEAGYPYVGVDQNCQYDAKSLGATISKYTFIKTGDELDLQDAVANVGPVPIAIDCEHESFFDYTDGIWDEPDCTSKYLSHAVLAVGYGTDNGVDYWLVKNSWGTGWGIDGYFKMRRNNNNKCGQAQHAVYPVV